MLRARLPEGPWRPSVRNAGIARGFAIVILGQMPPFAEDTIPVVFPAPERPARAVFPQGGAALVGGDGGRRAGRLLSVVQIRAGPADREG